jgi:hypothetical protein
MTRIYMISVSRPVGAMDIEHDWCAFDDLTYCGESTDSIGYGRTPRAAIEDLMQQIDEMDAEFAHPTTGWKRNEPIGK